MFELKTEARDAKTDAKTLRAKGRLPAVFYGRKESSTAVSLNPMEFKKIWQKAGESSVITLETVKGPVGAIIHDIQFDPVTSEPTHVDFYVVEQDKPIEVGVPLEFIGVSNAVKDLSGTLVKVLHELEIKALPKNLPHSLTVDISKITEINGHIVAKDISLPSGVTLMTKENEIIALVAAPREEKEEEPPATIDMSAIEVEKRGKEEVPAEAGAEAPEAKGKPEKPEQKEQKQK